MTLSTTGRFPTDRPERYAKQLCAHLGRKLETVFEDGDGTVTFGTAVARLTSTPSGLEVAVSGTEDVDVHRVMAVVGSHLEGFASKEGTLMHWDDAALAAAARAAREEQLAARRAAEEAQAASGATA